ncbi:MAG: hypothetical protein EZS28_043357 [Streblomastix strix]|uniref:Uncharacterized protein n=1 Tax=Streblomastix strix TaxID=222440 RepID=A0A5J4TRF7_9EUKA|nr:MAG: hypothetical protein EZS28_043357 [Streblomastix strix]
MKENEQQTSSQNQQTLAPDSNQKTQVPTRKSINYDLGCIAEGDNNGNITIIGIPDPKMDMLHMNGKLEINKMFEFKAHDDAIWSIDESVSMSGITQTDLMPINGAKITQAQIVSASADSTVRLWNIDTDGNPDPFYHGESLTFHS